MYLFKCFNFERRESVKQLNAEKLVFVCKNRRLYRRERASKKFADAYMQHPPPVISSAPEHVVAGEVELALVGAEHLQVSDRRLLVCRGIHLAPSSAGPVRGYALAVSWLSCHLHA